MKAAKVLKARPWTLASLASARPYAAIFKTKSFDMLSTDFQPSKIEISEVEARKLLGKIREEAMSRIEYEGMEAMSRIEYEGMEGLAKLSVVRLEEYGTFLDQEGGPGPFLDQQGGPGPFSDQQGCPGMGSFTSSPALVAEDNQDDALSFQPGAHEELVERCRKELMELPTPLERRFRNYSLQSTQSTQEKDNIEAERNIRLMQWNHLSQTLGTKNDKFVCCPAEALVWETRRWRLLHEILRYEPDIICLQEVDHFNLLERALGSVGYSGRFVPKPDSPCIYLPENNGPDGCAIFYKNSKFDLVSESKRVLEVWRVQSNQVVLCLNLKHRDTMKELFVATTHLKARQGALLSTMRNEQGKDMLDWLAESAAGKPLLLSGDFNADPSEPVYQSVVHHASLNLSSAYKSDNPGVDEYTTWKIRETGEQKYVLDYIFHSEFLTPVSVLEMPSEEEIGAHRLPSLQFPSDHLSLVADFHLI